MIKINHEINAPTMTIQIEGGKTPMFTAREFEEIGYNVVVFPISTLYAAAWAVRNVMEELIVKGTTRECMDKMIAFTDFNQLIGLHEIRKKEGYYYKELLRGKN
jgi:2-methylisocitrate lyase-like PEP mutase family enzyme